ncbi:MAG: alpha/beta hydrolase [Polyangiaceae bacterium]
MPRPFPNPAGVALLLGTAVALSSGSGHAEKFTLATLPYQPAWCAPEMDALTGEVCHVAGTPAPDGRRTLVIFLHGVIAKNTMWQWLQERGIAKAANEFHFDAIVPQAPRVGPGGAGGFAWPGLGKTEGVDEDAMLEEWRTARRTLEARNGRPFDEVYVVGFSSGAYFATSLALRAKLEVDGYVVLAGGARRAPAPDTSPRVPVFVGVCANDHASAPEARELGHFLKAQGWPARIDELQVGHGVSDVHVGHALAWFRGLRERARGG